MPLLLLTVLAACIPEKVSADSGIAQPMDDTEVEADADTDADSDADSDSDADADSDTDTDSDADTDVGDPDSDGDGLTDAEEAALGTDPTNPDTDGDGLTDGDEVNQHGTDPLYEDSDFDCLSDGDEVDVYGTDPTLADTDGGGRTDGAELLLDNTDATNSGDDNNASDPGLFGGHMDVDSSNFLTVFENGSNSAHAHDYDKLGGASVDFFDTSSKAHAISEDVATDQAFKLVVLNADLSPGARITFGGAYDETDPSSWTVGTTYDDTAVGSLTIWTLDGSGGTRQLSEASVSFCPLAIPKEELHPTVTGCVKENKAGANGEWRNGALVVQAVAVNPDLTDGFTLDGAISAGDHGGATSGLLWELVMFEHWDGPCYHESGWQDTRDSRYD